MTKFIVGWLSRPSTDFGLSGSRVRDDLQEHPGNPCAGVFFFVQADHMIAAPRVSDGRITSLTRTAAPFATHQQKKTPRT